MDLSIVIVNWNSGRLLGECLRSIEQCVTGLTYEAIVVDNASDPSDVDLLRDLERAIPWSRFTFSEENLGYARANNLALARATGDHVLLLNPDTTLIMGGLDRLLTIADGQDVGMVACRLLNPDGTSQESLYYFPTLRRAVITALLLHKVMPRRLAHRFQFSSLDYESSQSPDWVAGAFMLLPASVAERAGGFDESIFMYGEDLEFCYRVRNLGLRIAYTPDFSIVHHGGHSGSQAFSDADRERRVYRAIFYFYEKHLGRGRLAVARAAFAAGALLRMAGYALGSLVPGRRSRAVAALRTQWSVFLTQLGLR